MNIFNAQLKSKNCLFDFHFLHLEPIEMNVGSTFEMTTALMNTLFGSLACYSVQRSPALANQKCPPNKKKYIYIWKANSQLKRMHFLYILRSNFNARQNKTNKERTYSKQKKNKRIQLCIVVTFFVLFFFFANEKKMHDVISKINCNFLIILKKRRLCEYVLYKCVIVCVFTGTSMSYRCVCYKSSHPELKTIQCWHEWYRNEAIQWFKQIAGTMQAHVKCRANDLQKELRTIQFSRQKSDGKM